MNTRATHSSNEELREANSCLALGVGLGAVGTTTALFAGAPCPLCLVLAPALIGVGSLEAIPDSKKDRGTHVGGGTRPMPIAN